MITKPSEPDRAANRKITRQQGGEEALKNHCWFSTSTSAGLLTLSPTASSYGKLRRCGVDAWPVR